MGCCFSCPYRTIYIERKVPNYNSYKEQFYTDKKIINIDQTVSGYKYKQHINDSLIQFGDKILVGHKTFRQQGVTNKSTIRIIKNHANNLF